MMVGRALGGRFRAMGTSFEPANSEGTQSAPASGFEKLFLETKMLLKIQHVTENSNATLCRETGDKVSEINCLEIECNGGKGSESNSENEGITPEVDENKAPAFHGSGITQEVHENKQLIVSILRCY
jgi:hypothetical protein